MSDDKLGEFPESDLSAYQEILKRQAEALARATEERFISEPLARLMLEPLTKVPVVVQMMQPSEEERAELLAAHEEWQRALHKRADRYIEAWSESAPFAVGREAEVARHHQPIEDQWGELHCEGCDRGYGADVEAPEWPCSTAEMLGA